MKKNKMMRLASAMMVLTLMSTSVISGTFAKYVTSDSASDVARVAKFGVTVTAAGSLFAETYKKATGNTPGDGSDTPATLSVESNGAVNDVSKLVAPGTKNEDGMTFAITGTPEVDVQVTISVDDDNEDVFLGIKTGLPNMTTGKNDDTFDNNTKYEPVKYTLWQDKGSGFVKVTDAIDVNSTTLASKLESLSATFTANTNLATAIGTLKITWAWDFDDNGAGTYDKQDTLLGDLAAGTTLAPATTLTAGTDYNLETGLEVTVTVTQID